MTFTEIASVAVIVVALTEVGIPMFNRARERSGQLASIYTTTYAVTVQSGSLTKLACQLRAATVGNNALIRYDDIFRSEEVVGDSEAGEKCNICLVGLDEWLHCKANCQPATLRQLIRLGLEHKGALPNFAEVVALGSYNIQSNRVGNRLYSAIRLRQRRLGSVQVFIKWVQC